MEEDFVPPESRKYVAMLNGERKLRGGVALNSNVCMSKDEVAEYEPSACIRCGRCVDVCPGRVMPNALANAVERDDMDAFMSLNGMECCECGCCSYICPAKRHLTQTIAGARKLVLASRKK